MKKINQQTIAFLQRAIGTEPYDIQPLKGDASNRIYSRIQQKKPILYFKCNISILILCLPSFLNIQKHFEKHNIAVPQIHSYNQDEGLILLEDLGDTLLQDISKNRWGFYQKAIDQLMKIHHQATNDPFPCHAFQVIFDTKTLMEEMTYTQKHLLENSFHISLSDPHKKEFIDICSRLDQDPKCMIHRDFHSRNIMIVSDQVKII